MEEDKIREYIIKGGKIFNVEYVDTVRDGGTKIIKCSKSFDGEPWFYIHKDNKTIHTEYPTTNKNILTDELLKEYLIERLIVFIKRTEEQLQRDKNTLEEII